MQEFYLEDKVNHKIITGIKAHDDVNWSPYDYSVYGNALSRSKLYNTIINIKGRPEWMDERLVNQLALRDSKEMLEGMLRRSLPDIKLQQILAHTEMSKKEQIRLWKGVELKVTDLLWFDWLAQKAGYLLDVYHKEVTPSRYADKQFPVMYIAEPNQNIEKFGKSNMSDGEMRAVLQDRKVLVVHVYYKGDIWHCFYGTYKGINGEEPGVMGSQSHYHYISDKWGYSREKLNQFIEENNMPSSPVHILLKRENLGLDNTKT